MILTDNLNDNLDNQDLDEQNKQESLAWNNYKESLSQITWKSIGMILLGLFAGLLVFRSSQKDEEPNIGYFLVIFGIFLIIASILYLVRVIDLRKRYKQIINEHKKNHK